MFLKGAAETERLGAQGALKRTNSRVDAEVFVEMML